MLYLRSIDEDILSPVKAQNLKNRKFLILSSIQQMQAASYLPRHREGLYFPCPWL